MVYIVMNDVVDSHFLQVTSGPYVCMFQTLLSVLLQVVQEMVEEVLQQLMVIQSRRANVPQEVLFPFVPVAPRQRRQLPAPTKPVYAGM